MSKITYLLRHKDAKYPSARYKVDTDLLKGTCFEPYSWDMNGDIFEEHFFAECYFKHDACTHWYFCGEDYDGDLTEGGAYYHICGAHSLDSHIQTMLFMWEVNRRIASSESKYADGYYRENEYVTALIETLLSKYEIIEVGGND